MKALITLIALVFTIGGSAQDPHHEFRTQITGKDVNVVHPKITVFMTKYLELKAEGDMEYTIDDEDIQLSQVFKMLQWDGAVKELTITYYVKPVEHLLYVESCEIHGDFETAYEFFFQYWETLHTSADGSRSRYHMRDSIVLTPSEDATRATMVITSLSARK